MTKMLIQEYQPHWESDFESLRTVLFEALRGMHIRIEHVGSTAVRQLAAKPVIDIDIAYGTEVSFALLKSRLENIGYSHHGDQGITGREVFKRKGAGIKHGVLDAIQHHLYACRFENEEYQRHLMFRNFLAGNQPAREAYQNLKYKIAEKANQDRKTYARLKEVLAQEFILTILKQAQEEQDKR